MTLYNNNAEFGRVHGIVRQTVSKLIKRGDLEARRDGKIDSENKTNRDWIIRRLERTKSGQADGGKKSAAKNKTVNPATPDTENDQSETEDNNIVYSNDLTVKSGVDVAKAREQLRKLQIQNEKELGRLIDRELIKKYFGEIGSIIVNYFFPLGGRLAPVVAGACGSNDPEHISEIKNIIDKEVSRSLKQFKEKAGDILKDAGQ